MLNRHSGFYLLLLFSFFVLPVSALGESLDTFDAVIQPPENQANKELLYYDLQTAPGEKEQLSVKLTNKSGQEMVLKLSFNRAVTNSAGVIEYSGVNEDRSQSAPYDIEKLASLSETTVELAPEASKTVYLTVTMPAEGFSGVLAGGIYIEQVSQEAVTGNIKNVFSREIAVLLRSEAAEVKPELTIAKARSIQSNYRNMFEVDIENTQAVYLKNVTVNYSVYLNGEATNISGSKEHMSIAPNTIFQFHIPLKGEQFGAGKYQVKTEVVAGENSWQGEPAFTLSQTKATNYNADDVTVEKTPQLGPWVIGGGLLAVAAISGVLIWLILRNRKLQQELARKRRKKATAQKRKRRQMTQP